MIKAAIFDYDGVIVDSFTNIFDIYKIIASKFNLKIPDDIEEFRVLYGYNHAELHRNINLDPKYEDEVQEIFNSEKLKSVPELFNGMKDALDILSKKYKLFVVSNSTIEDINHKLEKYDISRYFKEVHGIKGKGYRKNEIIKNIFKEYNIDKNEVVLIGDRTMDYDIGKELGLDDKNILIVEYGWGYDKSKVKINYIINKPLDIIQAIQEIDK